MLVNGRPCLAKSHGIRKRVESILIRVIADVLTWLWSGEERSASSESAGLTGNQGNKFLLQLNMAYKALKHCSIVEPLGV